MTGIAGVDAVAVICFAAVTVLALARLGRRPGLERFLDDAFHAVMGVAMTAMFWPGTGQSAGVWVAVIGLLLVWPLLVLTLAVRRPDGPVSLGHTGYWIACAVLMVVVVAADHGSAGRSGMTSMASMPGGAHPVEAGIGGGALGTAVQAVAGWPVWPLIGAGFLVYAGLVLLGSRQLPGPRRPITERACVAVMAAGMALMAFSL